MPRDRDDRLREVPLSTDLARTAAALRWALLRGSLRTGPGSTQRQLGFGLGALVGAVLSLGAFHALSSARGQHGEDLASVLFTVLCAGWVVLPVLTFSSNDLLDPARLALLPLTRWQLLTVMGVGALVGVAPVATTIAALGLVPATGGGPVSALVAVLAVLLLLLLCVSVSRAVTAALSGLLRSRRGRDLGVVLAALVGLSVQLGNSALQVALRRHDGTGGGSSDRVGGLAHVLRWTPPGLLATAPRRPLPAAFAVLLLVAAIVGVVLVVWERCVRRALERVDSSGPRARRSTGLAPRGLPLPGGRVGAVAAKDLRYLAREPRRIVSTVFGLLLPVLPFVVGPLFLSNRPPPHGLVFAVCGLALLSGLGGANRFGLDGTATWLLLSTATHPRDSARGLLGGDLATTAVCLPVLLVLAAVLAALTGGWSLLPPALGLAVALFCVTVGASGLLAVSAPIPVSPNANVFGGSGSTGQGCAAGVFTLGALVGSAAACLPLLALLLPALLSDTHGTAYGVALLVVGPAYGLGVGTVLREAAARRWTTRAPEVLQVLASANG